MYRLNFLCRATGGIIPLLATIHVWRAIYEGKGGGQIAGYGLSQLISYYLVITNLHLYAARWRNSVIRELGFKLNFLMWIVVAALRFALQLCFIGVLYLLTERIGAQPATSTTSGPPPDPAAKPSVLLHCPVF